MKKRGDYLIERQKIVERADFNYDDRQKIAKKNDAPVIITTEIFPDNLRNFDMAVASRLIEMSGDNIVTFVDPADNHRMNGKKLVGTDERGLYRLDNEKEYLKEWANEN